MLVGRNFHYQEPQHFIVGRSLGTNRYFFGRGLIRIPHRSLCRLTPPPASFRTGLFPSPGYSMPVSEQESLEFSHMLKRFLFNQIPLIIVNIFMLCTRTSNLSNTIMPHFFNYPVSNSRICEFLNSGPCLSYST